MDRSFAGFVVEEEVLDLEEGGDHGADRNAG
jgi:hypothetical protein